MDDILTRTISLDCDIDHAFRVFTERVDLWWPRGHRRNRDATLRFERDWLIERAPDGSEWAMADVTAMEPPRRLALDWYPGSPNAPTSVELQFTSKGDGTEVTVTHRALTAETRSIWPQRVTRFIDGWDSVLPALQQFIRTDKGG
ncbi:MAG: SRPBCC domain-containing protein [Devosia sp.]